MSFNRLKYDTCTYKSDIHQSMNIGNYALYPGKYQNEHQCRITDGILQNNSVSVFKGNLIDLESDLRGQDRVMSRCAKFQYHPLFKQPEQSGYPSGPINYKNVVVNKPSCSMYCQNKPVMPPNIQNAFNINSYH